MIIFSSSEIKYKSFKDSRVFFSAVGSDSGLIGMNGCLQTYPPQGHRLTHLGQIINQDFCFTLDTTNFGSTVNIQNSTHSVFFFVKNLVSHYISNNVYRIFVAGIFYISSYPLRLFRIWFNSIL